MGDEFQPLGREGAGRAWLHQRLPGKYRRAEAFSALADLGICQTGRLAETEEVHLSGRSIQNQLALDA
jgi:hypothetical protein